MRIWNRSFGGALTKPALRVLSTRNVCLRQKYTHSTSLLGALLVRLAKPMVCVTARLLVTLFYIIAGIFTHPQNKNNKRREIKCFPFFYADME